MTATFGNRFGNFLPGTGVSSSNAISADMAVASVVHETDGQVENDAVAVTDIKNDDGGDGEDSYKQYNGDGTTDAGWPDGSAWISFEKMFVIARYERLMS